MKQRHPITEADAATQAEALANNERFCRDIGLPLTCDECDQEAVELFKVRCGGFGPDSDRLWCSECVESLGLIAQKQPCGHLESAQIKPGNTNAGACRLCHDDLRQSK